MKQNKSYSTCTGALTNLKGTFVSQNNFFNEKLIQGRWKINTFNNSIEAHFTKNTLEIQFHEKNEP